MKIVALTNVHLMLNIHIQQMKKIIVLNHVLHMAKYQMILNALNQHVNQWEKLLLMEYVWLVLKVLDLR